MRGNTYTAYDIDHPGAREMNRLLLAGTVPYMAGKKYRELGYMLCNEPHFFTKEGVWATGSVSEFTIDKFRQWLRRRHVTIDRLNELWQTHYAGFDSVDIAIPLAAELSIASRRSAQCLTARDILTGVSVSLKPVLKPYEVLFVKIDAEQP